MIRRGVDPWRVVPRVNDHVMDRPAREHRLGNAPVLAGGIGGIDPSALPGADEDTGWHGFLSLCAGLKMARLAGGPSSLEGRESIFRCPAPGVTAHG